jgi:hypothetical protein
LNRIPVTALLALSALAFSASPVLAQKFALPESVAVPRSNPGGVTDRDDLQLCGSSGGGSRVRPNCDQEETTTLRVEQELKFSIELLGIPSLQCAATTTTEYQQRDTSASVDGAIAISDCTAASGAYKVLVRVKDASGESEVLEFDETWQRSDDRDVAFSANYPIGDDTELVSVRLRNLTCTCADPPEVSSDPPEGAAGGFSP